MGITEAKASAKPTHLPSATRPSVVTRQNTAKLHIPGKNPRRNRIVVCGPCCTCVKAIRMASATGKGVRAPLRVGPRLGARPVVVSTRATAEITRRGMSQALRVAGATPSPVWGRSARARMKLASAALKAATAIRLTRVARAASAAKPSPCSWARKKSTGPATRGRLAKTPPTRGPQRRPATVTEMMSAGTTMIFRRRSTGASEEEKGDGREEGKQDDPAVEHVAEEARHRDPRLLGDRPDHEVGRIADIGVGAHGDGAHADGGEDGPRHPDHVGREPQALPEGQEGEIGRRVVEERRQRAGRPEELPGL